METTFSLQDVESSLRSIADQDGTIPYVVAQYTAMIAWVGYSFNVQFYEISPINVCDFIAWLRSKVMRKNG